MAFGSTELRKAGENVVGQGRRPLLAAIGAGEIAVRQVRELPALTQTQAERLQAALRERAGSLSPEAVRGLVGACVTQARSVYDGLSQRGEQVSDRVLARVRSQPRLRRVLGGLAEAIDEASDAVEDAIENAIGSNGNGSPDPAPARRSAPRRGPLATTE